MVAVEYRCKQCGRVLFEAETTLTVSIKIRCKRCGDWNRIHAGSDVAAH